MSVIVDGVMRKGAQRESAFVQIFRIAQHGQHKITAAHVMREVAEKHAAGVMRKGAQRESVFVQIFRIAQHGHHEIGAAHVMREVAEKHAAVRVIPHVLDNGSAKRVAMRFAQLIRRGIGKTFEQHRLDAGVPSGIDDGFVRKDGVRRNWRRAGGQHDRCRQKHAEFPYASFHFPTIRPFD